jgi:hypothetical protein
MLSLSPGSQADPTVVIVFFGHPRADLTLLYQQPTAGYREVTGKYHPCILLVSLNGAHTSYIGEVYKDDTRILQEISEKKRKRKHFSAVQKRQKRQKMPKMAISGNKEHIVAK